MSFQEVFAVSPQNPRLTEVSSVRLLPTGLQTLPAKTAKGYRVSPIKQPKRVLFNLRRFDLNCGESASTLRFLLPLVCALGRKVELHVEGTLAHRPLTPFYEELVSHGARLSPEDSYPLSVSGQIKGGRFVLPGNISSQFVS